MKRIYHPYWLWEETKYNMWGLSKTRNEMLSMAVDFMGNTKLFEKWMFKVINDWKYSCEHNLTNTSSNRIAYIGWAACAYKLSCPEDIVRSAWGMLSDKQREDANSSAGKAIKEWEYKNG